MSLLDQARQTAAPRRMEDEDDEVVTTAKKSKGAEYQKKQKEIRYRAALLIQSALKRASVQLSLEETAAIELLTKKPGSGTPHSFGKPIIFRLFGDTPKVGNKATAFEVFEKTGKGYQEVKQLIRKWAEKGTAVAYDAATKTYTLERIGALPSFAVKEE